ncbi:hypothetical protein [Streptomyces sp. NPDC047028]|uniref:hypothetical protein n=1 Tax=Streptomyces sp. NPDC047028 TaxID=3155793 RepID=UPI00340AE642
MITMCLASMIGSCAWRLPDRIVVESNGTCADLRAFLRDPIPRPRRGCRDGRDRDARPVGDAWCEPPVRKADMKAPAVAPPEPRRPAPAPARRLFRVLLQGSAGPAGAVYVAALSLHLALLAVMDTADSPSVGERLRSWDGAFYTGIARHGYPGAFSTAGHPTGHALAFFPAYPGLIRCVHAVTRLGYGAAALTAAQLAAIAALFAVHRLFSALYDHRTATVATILVACVQPMSLVFFMAYGESLFLALAAASLWAVYRRAWLSAGGLALLAGLTRPAAAALAAAVAVAAGQWMWRERHVAWRPLAAVALSCAGTPAYLLWVGFRVGRLDAYFVIEETGWGTHWDGGKAFVASLVDTLTRSDGWVLVSTCVLLLSCLVATAVAWQRTAWLPFLVYGTGILVIALTQSNFQHSKLRLVIPALVFLVPVARVLSRARPLAAVLVLTAGALFGSWYGAYMLTVWHYAI